MEKMPDARAENDKHPINHAKFSLKIKHSMNLRAFFLRFLFLYLLLIIAGSIAMNFLGVSSSIGVNLTAFLCAVFYAAMSFGKHNQRFFTGGEKYRVFGGVLAFDLALQMSVFSWLVPQGKLSAALFLNAFLFIGLLHAVSLYFFFKIIANVLKNKNYFK